MKGILQLLGLRSRTARSAEDAGDTVFFTTAYTQQGVDPALLVPWAARAPQVQAERLAPQHGVRLLQNLWAQDASMSELGEHAAERMARFIDFARVPAGRAVIVQDEYSNFMLVLLTGSMAVERTQPWGERLQLAEARAGDLLGEMSLLDSGLRFSTCTAITDCEIAVLGAEALDEMMDQDAALAASLIAVLARKLSRRLRAVSARLSERPL